MLHSLHDVRGSSFLLPAGKGGDFFLGGGWGEGSRGFQGERREDQSSPTVCKGETEKTDCQHTANGGNGEHCRALRGVSDNFFRDTNKILQTPPLKG